MAEKDNCEHTCECKCEHNTGNSKLDNALDTPLQCFIDLLLNDFWV